MVIAGGGFGGLYAARRLEAALAPQSAHITLVSDSNFLLYTPLLPGAAAGTLEPRHVVVPLREELERTDIRLGRVTAAEPERSQLRVRTVDGRDERLYYDHLIMSLGSVPRVLPIPGLTEYGVGFKTLSEAIALRNRTLLHLEVAESSDDPEERRRRLTFVFVGAGYAGVEGIAELQDYVAHVIDRYPRCRLEGTRWILVEAEARIKDGVSRGVPGRISTLEHIRAGRARNQSRGASSTRSTRIRRRQSAASGRSRPQRPTASSAAPRQPAVAGEGEEARGHASHTLRTESNTESPYLCPIQRASHGRASNAC